MLDWRGPCLSCVHAPLAIAGRLDYLF